MASHSLPSTTAEENDFVLYEDYHHPSYRHPSYSQGGSTYYQPAIGSDMSAFPDPLSSNISDQLQGHEQQQLNKQFYPMVTTTHELTQIPPASSAPAYEHNSAYSSFSESIGSSLSEADAPPNILINPPTLPYLPSHGHTLPHDYRSTPSASPSTSNGEFNNSSSGISASETGSTRNSPYQPVESAFTKIAFERANFVDPNLIQERPEAPTSGSPNWANIHPGSPALMSPSTSPKLTRTYSGGVSPNRSHPYRRPSTSSVTSWPRSPRDSPSAGTMDIEHDYYHRGDAPRMIGPLPGRSPSRGSHKGPEGPVVSGKDGKETLCQECNKCFRDLRAHQLTHLHERPEKCPIATCEYSRKGFARKYDCQRHTLTHYKGTMVCCFCPGSGSAMEKSFNRADVFKRHLMAVHNVEQTPPNGRQKKPNSSTSNPALNKGKVIASPSSTSPPPQGGYTSGKCSTCSMTFDTAQQFYEHLDDCVLSKVCEEEPAAGPNEKNLSSVRIEEVEAVLSPATLKHEDSTTTDDDEEMDVDLDDPKDESYTTGKRKRPSGKKRSGQSESQSPVKPPVRRRKKRKNFPAAWGAKPEQMVTKRRCLSVYDGPMIICKDEMMMSTEYEVKTNIGKDGGVQVSDLDFWTMRRAEAFLDAAPSRGGEALPLGIVH